MDSWRRAGVERAALPAVRADAKNTVAVGQYAGYRPGSHPERPTPES